MIEVDAFRRLILASHSVPLLRHFYHSLSFPSDQTNYRKILEQVIDYQVGELHESTFVAVWEELRTFLVAARPSCENTLIRFFHEVLCQGERLCFLSAVLHRVALIGGLEAEFAEAYCILLDETRSHSFTEEVAFRKLKSEVKPLT